MATKRRSPRKVWAVSIGSHGSTVRLYERGKAGKLHLRWWNGQGFSTRALGHTDRKRGEQQARELSGELLAAGENEARGLLTLGMLFARYGAEVTPRKAPAQRKEDRRRMDLWTHVLGSDRNCETIDAASIERFRGQREAGTLAVPGRKLRGSPSPRTVGADIGFLHAALNWAELLRGQDGKPILPRNPIARIERPNTANPKRPVATFDRFLAIRATADSVDPQGLFGGFYELVEALGWRVSALCQLWASDYDRTVSAEAPFGRIRKREETDKQRVGMWVPLAPDARAALDRLVSSRQIVGDVPIFPAPRRAGQSWTRHHAKDLLVRAERAAGLEPLRGGVWHPYRRKWVTERKHLPDVDVARAGGWRTPQTLTQCYQQPDAKTMLAVVTEPRKLRASE